MKYFVVLIIAFVIPTAVIAKGACEPDVEKFCKGLAKGPQVTTCLNQHEAELAPACKAAREAARKGAGEEKKEK
jgi:hypothetical protein